MITWSSALGFNDNIQSFKIVSPLLLYHGPRISSITMQLSSAFFNSEHMPFCFLASVAWTTYNHTCICEAMEGINGIINISYTDEVKKSYNLCSWRTYSCFHLQLIYRVCWNQFFCIHTLRKIVILSFLF